MKRWLGRLIMAAGCACLAVIVLAEAGDERLVGTWKQVGTTNNMVYNGRTNELVFDGKYASFWFLKLPYSVEGTNLILSIQTNVNLSLSIQSKSNNLVASRNESSASGPETKIPVPFQLHGRELSLGVGTQELRFVRLPEK